MTADHISSLCVLLQHLTTERHSCTELFACGLDSVVKTLLSQACYLHALMVGTSILDGCWMQICILVHEAGRKRRHLPNVSPVLCTKKPHYCRDEGWHAPLLDM